MRLRTATVSAGGQSRSPAVEVLPNGLTLVVQDHRAADIVAVYLWVATGVVTRARRHSATLTSRNTCSSRARTRSAPVYAANVTKVTPADVQRVAKQYLGVLRTVIVQPP
jgi:predicted Zn-dependent peptidase